MLLECMFIPLGFIRIEEIIRLRYTIKTYLFLTVLSNIVYFSSRFCQKT